MRYEKAIKKLVAKADEKRYSQVEIAAGSNLSPAQISRIFNFESKPSAESLSAIAKFLDLPPEEILRDAGFLPEKMGRSVLEEKGLYLLNGFETDEYQQRAIQLLELLRKSEEQEIANAKKNKKPKPAESS